MRGRRRADSSVVVPVVIVVVPVVAVPVVVIIVVVIVVDADADLVGAGRGRRRRRCGRRRQGGRRSGARTASWIDPLTRVLPADALGAVLAIVVAIGPAVMLAAVIVLSWLRVVAGHALPGTGLVGAFRSVVTGRARRCIVGGILGGVLGRGGS